MWRELKTGFLMMVVMTVLTGFVYPGAITAVARLAFPHQADGSLVTADGRVVGSRLIGQSFTKPEYFHPRPSAAGGGYDPTASGGTNLGPTSAKLVNGATAKDDKGHETVAFDGIKDRLVHYCVENGLPYYSSRPLDGFKAADGSLDDVKLIDAFNDRAAPLEVRALEPVPADAVTASASGLDPNISPANADLQAARVAHARGVPVDRVRQIVAAHTDGRTWGILGEPRVNVLELNLALDAQLPRR